MKFFFPIILILFSFVNAQQLNLTKEEENYIKNAPPIKTAYIDYFPPFSFFENNIQVGLTHDLFDIISKKTGLKFEKVIGTWPQIYKKFKNAKIDVISEISYTKNRAVFTSYTKPYHEIPLGVFTRDDFGIYNGIKSLQGKTVAVIKNSYIKKRLLKIPGIKLIEAESADQNFSALHEKKIDAVLNNVMGVYKIEKLMFSDIKLAGVFEYPGLKKEDLRFGIRKENVLLSSIINKTLNSIPYSTMTRLRHKWILNANVNKLNLKETNFLKKHPKITFLLNSSRPPFSFKQNGENVGVVVDYIKAIGRKVGFKPIFLRDNIGVDESLRQLESKSRSFDTLAYSVRTKEREKNFIFGDSFLSYPLMIITNKKGFYIGKLSDLKNKKVAVVEGFLTNDWLKKDYPSIKIVSVKNTLEALKMLNDKKISAYIGNMQIVNYLMQNYDLENIKISASADFGIVNYKFIAPKDLATLIPIMNKGYRQMSPLEHNTIHQKWFANKTIEKLDYSLLWKIILVFFIIIAWILWWSRRLQLAKEKTEQALTKLEMTKVELNKQKEEFELIFKYSKDGIAILDLNSKFLNFNDAYLKMLNYSKEQILEKTSIELAAPEYKEKMLEAIKASIKRGFIENFELTYITANNERIDVNMSISLLPDKKRLLVVVKDVSTLKLLEEQSRLASMGEMIGNIAHQWRQPLSVISTTASGLKLKSDFEEVGNEQIKEFSDIIVLQTNYLSQTIEDFKNFIKADANFANVSLHNILMETKSLVDASLKNNYVELVFDFEDDLKIKAIKSEFIQALINIINNSKDALVENLRDNRFIFINTKKVDEDTIILKIYDNAGGIEENILDRVFEPYFTTKHQSIGTGLGLYIVDRIIRVKHQTNFSIYNKEYEYKKKKYKGCCFKIILRS